MSYEVLGLKRGAGLEEIKRKYQELSKKYHPDVVGNNRKFIEITNAYNKLIKGDDEFENIYIEENSFGKNMKSMFSKEEKKDLDIKTSVNFRIRNQGKVAEISYKRRVICNDCEGNGYLSVRTCSRCDGKGFYLEKREELIKYNVKKDCRECNNGFIFENKCKKCHGDGHLIKKENMRTMLIGDIIIIKGMGNEFHDIREGNHRGDLIIKPEIDFEDFKFEKGLLVKEEEVPFYDIILNEKVFVNGINEMIEFNPNFKSTRTFKEKGLIVNNGRTDLVIKIRPKFERYDEKQLELIKKFKFYNIEKEI